MRPKCAASQEPMQAGQSARLVPRPRVEEEEAAELRPFSRTRTLQKCGGIATGENLNLSNFSNVFLLALV
jgi:hypothetical protein